MTTRSRPSDHSVITVTRRRRAQANRKKLTKRSVEALSVPTDPTGRITWDTEVRGFGVRVFPSGLRRFVYKYRNRYGRQRFGVIGTFGKWSVERARDEAKELLRAAEQGEDPAAAVSRDRDQPRFSEICERYMQEHASAHKKPSSVKIDGWYLERYILPALGGRTIQEIEHRDIASLHHELRETPVTANRVRALLSKIFSLAEDWGLRPQGSNPVRKIKKYPEERRERFLSSQELARLGQVLLDVEAEGSAPPQAIAAIRLLLFTGCRYSEILCLRWSEVDLERRSLLLGGSKTGSKPVRLSPPAMAILANLERVEGNPYVLPGKREGAHFVNVKDTWRSVRVLAGIPDVRLHDLRHTYASVGAGQGIGLPVLGALLGHKAPSTTARYAHLAPDPVREAAERIGAEIEAALEGRPPAQVQDFRRARALNPSMAGHSD